MGWWFRMVSLSDHLVQPDSAAYLYGLPVEVQTQLARIVRLVAGMSSDEKDFTRVAFGATAYAALLSDDENVAPSVEIISAAGVLVTLMAGLARPEGAVA